MAARLFSTQRLDLYRGSASIVVPKQNRKHAMAHENHYVIASEAARQLGISTKALRVYETHGLLTPVRTGAGWRTYGPDELSRAARIVALRGLDLSLGQIGDIIDGNPQSLGEALARHQAILEDRARQLTQKVQRVRTLRNELVDGCNPTSEHLVSAVGKCAFETVSFTLPWPWSGETFSFSPKHALTFITGPLASGKTRLARAIAEAHPDALFLALDRCADDCALAPKDSDHEARVASALVWLTGEGATVVPELIALVTALEASHPRALVLDLVEHGLDHGSQAALISYLRRRWQPSRSIYLMTRSSVVLDLQDDETVEPILYCPPNHSPPIIVQPIAGSFGYEAVSTCLASPDVRARSAGIIAIQTNVA